MAYIKRSITFGFDTKKKNGVLKTENVPIRMRVTFAGQRVDFAMGHSIDMDKWDADKQRVRNGCTNKLKISASQINADLSTCETVMQKIFQEFEIRDETPTKDQIKTLFNARMAGQDPNTEPVSEKDDEKGKKKKKEPAKRSFFDYYDEFYRQTARLHNWTTASHQKYTAVRNHLKDFRSRLSFEFFTERGLNDYVDFLRDKLDMRNSTIEKQIAHLKTFLKWAARKGYNTNFEFEYFRPKLRNIKQDPIVLDDAELTKLEEYPIPLTKKYLERVRDVFLFGCYTGMRYSDIRNLRKCDVRQDVIVFTTVKTADSLQINLNTTSRKILDKYKDIALEDDMALPVISNQKYNDYLKELCQLAEIDTMVRISYYKGNERIDEFRPKYSLIGSHTARRTFISRAIAKGVPPEVVMKWTGHSDYKAMKPYIAIADSTKAQEMTKFDDD